jgi:hypothetical protein
MQAEPHAAYLGLPRPASSEPRQRAGRSAAERPAVGVDYLVDQAGGQEAVLREGYRRLRTVVRHANMLELTEAMSMALLARAEDAYAQLGEHGPRALHEASLLLARAALAAAERA